MPRNSSGTFTLAPGNPVQAGTVIDPNWANPTLVDIADNITGSLSRTGEGSMLAALTMGGFKVGGLGNGSIGTDAPTALQVRDSTFSLVSSAASDSGGNDYTGNALLTDTPVAGTVYYFIADKDNTGDMTLRINGGAILAIQVSGGPVPPTGVKAGALVQVMLFGTVYRIVGGASAGGGGFQTIVSTDSQSVGATHAGSQIVIAPNTNAANSLLKLTAGNSIPLAYVPTLATSFIGMWDAGPGSNPANGTVRGQFYLISGAGTLTIYRTSVAPAYTPQATSVQPGDAILWNNLATTNEPTGWYFVRRTDLPVLGSDVAITPTSLFPTANDAQAWFDQSDAYMTALPAGFMPTTGGTFTGPPLYATTPATASTLANKQYVDDSISALPAQVASFNTRTGTVTLTSGDVTAALTYTPASLAGAAFTGAVTNTSTFGGKAFTATVYVANITGSVALDYANGQTQVLTCTGAVTLTAISNVPTGGVLRVVFKATNTGAIIFPGTLVWPNEISPDLTTGSLKKAVVVITNDATDLLGNASVY